MINSFDPTLDPSLLSLTGPLPPFLLADAGPASVREPSSLVLGGIAILMSVVYGWPGKQPSTAPTQPRADVVRRQERE